MDQVAIPKLSTLVTLLANGNREQMINVVLPDGTILDDINEMVKYSNWYVTAIYVQVDEEDNIPIVSVDVSQEVEVIIMPHIPDQSDN